MEVLLVKPEEITQFTPMGGNVDIDKYVPVIYDVQITVIEPLLGTTLYEKIKTDYENDTLAGDYLTLYTNYLRPILRHECFAEYVEIGNYFVSNGGIFKHQPQNSEVVSKDETSYLAQIHRSKAQMYIERAEKWLCCNHIPEYRVHHCHKVDVKVSGGWHLK